MDGTFHALEEVDAHEALDADLTAHAELLRLLLVEILVQLARLDVDGRRVDGQVQRGQELDHLLVVDRVLELGQLGPQGYGLQPLREGPDVRHVVIGLDVLPGPGDGHAVEDFKEVVVQARKQMIRRALRLGQLAPCVVDGLRLPEDRVDVRFRLQLPVDFLRVAAVGERQLVAQVVETVVDRGSRQHQDLCFHAGFDDAVHQPHVAVFLLAALAVRPVSVAEVVALVDDDKIIVAPVDPVDGQSDGRVAAVAGQVGVIEDVVAEPVFCERVVDQVAPVGHPVLGELLRAQDEHVLVPALVVFDDCKRGEGLAESDAVGKDAAVILFELVDDAKRRVLLEVEELVPDDAVLKAGRLVGEDVLGDVLQKLAEDVVERHVVDDLRGVLLIDRGDHVYDLTGDVLELFLVVPHLIEGLQELGAFWGFDAHDDVRHVVAPLAAEVDRGEAVHGTVGVGLVAVGDEHEVVHGVPGGVRPELRLAAHPLGAFPRDGLLFELVAQAHLELRAVQALLALEPGNVELAAFLRRLLRDEGRRREEEAQLLAGLQLLLELLKGVDGKACGGDGHFAAGADRLLQVVFDDVCGVVEYFHACVPRKKTFCGGGSSSAEAGLFLRCLVLSFHDVLGAAVECLADSQQDVGRDVFAASHLRDGCGADVTHFL